MSSLGRNLHAVIFKMFCFIPLRAVQSNKLPRNWRPPGFRGHRMWTMRTCERGAALQSDRRKTQPWFKKKRKIISKTVTYLLINNNKKSCLTRNTVLPNSVLNNSASISDWECCWEVFWAARLLKIQVQFCLGAAIWTTAKLVTMALTWHTRRMEDNLAIGSY